MDLTAGGFHGAARYHPDPAANPRRHQHAVRRLEFSAELHLRVSGRRTLEYLETVLPESIWVRLRPFLEDGSPRSSRQVRTPEQSMQELLASRESIVLAMAAARERDRS